MLAFLDSTVNIIEKVISNCDRGGRCDRKKRYTKNP
jgi:hypothetical protein